MTRTECVIGGATMGMITLFDMAVLIFLGSEEYRESRRLSRMAWRSFRMDVSASRKAAG